MSQGEYLERKQTILERVKSYEESNIDQGAAYSSDGPGGLLGAVLFVRVE